MGTDKGTDLIVVEPRAVMVGASTVVLLLLSGLGVAAQVCMTRAISVLCSLSAGLGGSGLGSNDSAGPCAHE